MMELLNNTDGKTSQGYRIERLYLHGTHRLVKVVVHRDSYKEQSYARAELLADGGTWTVLFYDLPSQWYNRPDQTIQPQGARTLADDITDRVMKILNKVKGK